jgi:hypothetical protein
MSKRAPAVDEWLLLIHQLPAKPAYLRVKIWRRLQAIGAAQVRNAVYALPRSDGNLGRFSELLTEITSGGGEALICDAALRAGFSDTEMRSLFDAARDADYEELVQQARTLLAAEEIGRAELARLRSRLEEIAAVDFFGAHGRQAADAILDEVQDKAGRHPDVSRHDPPPALSLSELGKRVWVTRRGIHIDRIASAWLIRRFIDPEARFKFVDSKGYAPEPGELRFDMADAEFTHEGDRCTFETLLSRAGLEGDPALAVLGEIVHELDVSDGKFSRAEAAGVSALIAGICAGTSNDEERLARGAAAFDGLHSHFSRSRGP